MYDNGVFGEDAELAKYLAVLQNPGNPSVKFFEFQSLGFLCGFVCLAMLISCLICLQPIFIQLRVDSVVNWGWGVVFIPAWILYVVPLIFFIIQTCTGSSKLKAIGSLIQYLCILTFNILLAIQLDTEKFFWSTIFIPIYIWILLSIISRLTSAPPSKYKEKAERQYIGVLFGLGYIGYLIRRLTLPTLEIVFMILISIKLDHTKSAWSWWIVSIPVWLFLAWKLLLRILDDQYLLRFSPLSQTMDAEEKKKRGSIARSFLIVHVILYVLFIPLLVLVLLKLDQSRDFFLAVAFVPLWVVLILLLCISCCCLPLICCGIGSLRPGDLAEEGGENPETDPGQPIWPPKNPTTPYIEGGSMNTHLDNNNNNHVALHDDNSSTESNQKREPEKSPEDVD